MFLCISSGLPLRIPQRFFLRILKILEVFPEIILRNFYKVFFRNSPRDSTHFSKYVCLLRNVSMDGEEYSKKNHLFVLLKDFFEFVFLILLNHIFQEFHCDVSPVIS